MKKFYVLTVLLLFTAALASAQVTFTVTNTNDTGAGSLRQAVIDANNNGNDPAVDTIRFDISLENQTIVLTSGVITVDENLHITGEDAHTVTISGNWDNVFNSTVGDRIFITPLASRSPLRIFDLAYLRFIDGNAGNQSGGADPGDPKSNGGHIYVEYTDFTIRYCTFTRGHANDGGSIEVEAGEILVEHSTFHGNLTRDDGGAFDIGSGTSFTLRNSTVAFNECGAGVAANTNNTGGAMRTDGTTTIDHSTLAYNIAAADGAIDGDDTNPTTISNSIIIENEDLAGVLSNCSGNIVDGGNNWTNTVNPCIASMNQDNNTNIRLATVLANNGGWTQNLSIDCRSSVYNAITPPSSVSVDQRDLPRGVGMDNIEPGAFELSSISCEDNDGDGINDVVDIDDDNDGIPDYIEIGLTAPGGSDPSDDDDGDGTPNYADADFAGCGTILNGVCSNFDADGDGVPNHFDLDSDDDGLPDLIEQGGVDVNGDGLVDDLRDADDNGLADLYDNPSHASSTLQDTNNDGAIDRIVDADGDGIEDYLDLDSDNDGIPDIVEVGGIDTNGDGRGDNYTDTDLDGFNDLLDSRSCVPVGDFGNFELGSSTGTITNGTNAEFPDGNFATVSGGSIVVDFEFIRTYESFRIVLQNTSGTTASIVAETSTDDVSYTPVSGSPVSINGSEYEVYAFDFSATRLVRYVRLTVSGAPVDIDVVEILRCDNGTPFMTSQDAGSDGIADSYTGSDQDGDGILNQFDLDSDNDGIPDVVEANGVDTDGDGIYDGFATDTDNDGFADAVDGSVNPGQALIETLADTDNDARADGYASGDADGDLLQNYLDLDADDDGIPDVIEAGGVDANNDGLYDGAEPANMTVGGNDTDGDGFVDAVDGTVSGSIAALILTGPEGSIPDGRPDDYPNGNTDNGSIGDNSYDFLDIDSDNDGITDLTEASGVFDTDGRVDATADGDGDGYKDFYDSDNSGTAIARIDTDTDGIPDYLDIDSDNDAIPDYIEAVCSDCMGGMATNTSHYTDNVSTTDNNGNGLYDVFENIDDTNAAAGANLGVNPQNTDGTGNPDYRDTDADDDGFMDWTEGFDVSGNGYTYPEIHARGIAFESNATTPPSVFTTTDDDSDGIYNWLDNQPITAGFIEANRPPFLDASNAVGFSPAPFVDANNNGLIDIYDPFITGGAETPTPRNGGADDDWRDASVNMPLPIELSLFEAERADQTALLTWISETEINSSHYEVERSRDGVAFEYIGRVEAAGNSQTAQEYSFVDAQPYEGVNYYRLRMVDQDASFEYSAIRTVRFDELGDAISLFPNPANDELQVGLPAGLEHQELQVAVTDVLGRDVQQVTWTVEDSLLQTLDVSDLPAGLYYLKMHTLTWQVVKPFRKQ